MRDIDGLLMILCLSFGIWVFCRWFWFGQESENDVVYGMTNTVRNISNFDRVSHNFTDSWLSTILPALIYAYSFVAEEAVRERLVIRTKSHITIHKFT